MTIRRRNHAKGQTTATASNQGAVSASLSLPESAPTQQSHLTDGVSPGSASMTQLGAAAPQPQEHRLLTRAYQSVQRAGANVLDRLPHSARKGAVALTAGAVFTGLAACNAGGNVALEAPSISPAADQVTEQPELPPRLPNTVFHLGATQVEVVEADLVAPGAEAQENTEALLRHLTQGTTPEKQAADVATLQALLTASGRPLPVSGPILLGPADVSAVSARFAALGLPLDNAGLQQFVTSRRLPLPAQLGPELAEAYLVAATQGQQVVYDLPPDLAPQHAGALAVFNGMDKATVQYFRAVLGATAAAPQGNFALQQGALGNEVVTLSDLDALAARAASWNVPLDPNKPYSPEDRNALVAHISPIGVRPADEQAKAEWYRRIVESSGYAWDTAVNQINVIGMRGYDVDSGVHDNMGFGEWNDTLAFVWKNESGAWSVREFRATTDPGVAVVNSAADDKNGDGSLDVATIAEGQHRYAIGTHFGRMGAARSQAESSSSPVYSDMDQDGHISEAEKQESIANGHLGYALNIHWANMGLDRVGANSYGCTVAKMEYDQFQAEITPLFRLSPGGFNYTVIKADTVRF